MAASMTDSPWAKFLERIVLPVAMGLLVWTARSQSLALEKQGEQLSQLTLQVAQLSGKVDQGIVERLTSNERRITSLEQENKELRQRLDDHIFNGRTGIR